MVAMDSLFSLRTWERPWKKAYYSSKIWNRPYSNKNSVDDSKTYKSMQGLWRKNTEKTVTQPRRIPEVTSVMYYFFLIYAIIFAFVRKYWSFYSHLLPVLTIIQHFTYKKIRSWIINFQYKDLEHLSLKVVFIVIKKSLCVVLILTILMQVH